MASPLTILPIVAITMVVMGFLGYTGRLSHPLMYVFITAVTLSVMVLSVLSDAESPLLLYVAGFMAWVSFVLALIVIALLFVTLRRNRYVDRGIGQVEPSDSDSEE